MKNLSKYITLNFLSILGYIFFVFLLTLLFILFPIAMHLDDVGIEESYNLINLLVFIAPFVYLYPLFEILIVFLSFIEFVFYKIKKIEPILVVPNKFNRLHLICFIIGLLLSFIPFVIVSYILIK